MRIELRGLEVFGHHGVLPEERERGQRFIVDVRVEPDSQRSQTTDDIADAVDYRAIVATVQEVVGRRTFHLLEAVSSTLAETLLATLPIGWVEVTVMKPDVVLDLPVEHSAVTVERYAATSSE